MNLSTTMCRPLLDEAITEDGSIAAIVFQASGAGAGIANKPIRSEILQAIAYFLGQNNDNKTKEEGKE